MTGIPGQEGRRRRVESAAELLYLFHLLSSPQPSCGCQLIHHQDSCCLPGCPQPEAAPTETNKGRSPAFYSFFSFSFYILNVASGFLRRKRTAWGLRIHTILSLKVSHVYLSCESEGNKSLSIVIPCWGFQLRKGRQKGGSAFFFLPSLPIWL